MACKRNDKEALQKLHFGSLFFMCRSGVRVPADAAETLSRNSLGIKDFTSDTKSENH